MSEVAAAAESAATAVTGATSEGSNEPDWSALPDNISGAEVSRLMAEHKAKQAAAPKKDPYTAAATAPESDNPIKEAAKEAKRKLKIDDEEVDEDEVIKTYKARRSHQQAANKELQEGKQLRKQAEEFAAMLKDPEKLFEIAEKLGHDTRSLTEKKLAKLLEDELLDPKEKEMRSAKARLAEYEKKEAEEKERVKTERNRAMEKKYAAEYETQFIDALKESQLPPSKQMVAAMAKYIGRSAELGFKMSPSEAASLVKDDMKQAQARLFKDADAQTLIALLGEDLANKIRQHDISKLKSPEQFLRTPERSGEQRDRPKKEKAPEKRPMSAAEWARFRNS